MSPPDVHATRLRTAAVRTFARIREAPPIAPVELALDRLRQTAFVHALLAPSGPQACRAVGRLSAASLRVIRAPGSDLELPRPTRWTLELTEPEVQHCLNELRAPQDLEAACTRLTSTIDRNLKYYTLGDREQEDFSLWFHREYQAWLAIAENCRCLATGAPLLHPQLRLPFALPWARFDGAVLAGFVTALVRRLLGKQASMLTVITDGGQTPYLMYERVVDGNFDLVHLYKGQRKDDVLAQLAAAGLPVVYTKTMDIAPLREIWQSECQYLRDGNRGRHLLAVLQLFAERLRLDPLPPALRGLQRAGRDLDLGRAKRLLGPGLLPNIEVRAGRGALRVDTGSRLNLRLRGPFLLEAGDALAHARSLESASRSLTELAAQGLADGSLRVLPAGPLGPLANLATSLVAARLPAFLRTLTWSMRLLGSPLRLLVKIGDTGFLLHFRDGQLAQVRALPVPPAASAAEVWRHVVRDPSVGFVHFCLNLPFGRTAPLRVSRHGPTNLRRRVPRPRRGRRGEGSLYYPENAIADELLRHFKGLGLLNLLDFVTESFV